MKNILEKNELIAKFIGVKLLKDLLASKNGFINIHFHKLIFKNEYLNNKNILIDTTVNLKNNCFGRINLNRKILPNTNKLD